MILILEELLATLNAMHTVLCSIPTRKRSCRRFIRNYGWWEIVQSTYSDDRFKQAFRVGKETFYFILSKIESKIVKKNRNEIDCVFILSWKRGLPLYFRRDVWNC